MKTLACISSNRTISSNKTPSSIRTTSLTSKIKPNKY